MPNYLTHPAVKLGRLIHNGLRRNNWAPYREAITKVPRAELLKLMLGLPNFLTGEQVALVLRTASVHPHDYAPLLVEMQDAPKLSLDSLYHLQEMSVSVKFKNFDYEINIDDDLKAELLSKMKFKFS